jgi:radical SAM protein with 4Fe4S-binding SPASM domain
MENKLSWSYPIIVPYKVGNIYIEPTNHCNLRCIMCPHSKLRMKEGFMDWDLFLKIVDDVSSYNPNAFIQLFYVGESLLHPRILEMIRYLKQNNLRVHLATNATILDERMAYGLINARLDHITFSFDGTDKETYESIRINANYESVVENILRFLRIKCEEKADIQAVIEIIETKATKNKIPAFIKKFDGLPVKQIRIKPFLGWAGTIEYSKMAIKTPSKPNYPCNRPWRMLAITWDGLFLACCVDAERKFVLGDAHSDSVEDIWNGEKIQYLRKKLKNSKYNEIELCKNCKDIEVLSERFTFQE